MLVFTKIDEIRSAIADLRAKGKSIGFVPTMGALHNGHLSLLRISKAENDVSVCSIFVNPIQFNNPEDLEKYPRDLDDDIKKLESKGCDIVFAPSVEEMYPGEIDISYDFGSLEKVMEGGHRPGHFNGVAIVVKKLFEICLPHKAYFGEKDFQQLLIVRELVKIENIPVEVIGCPIIRERDGLAMSSRNVRLSEHNRSIAPEIYCTLMRLKDQAGKYPFDKALREAEKRLIRHREIKLEYVEIVDESSLLKVDGWDRAKHLRAFIALFLGDVRLIDNMKIT
ncbi:MAG TPA: pantoate--beta-alanine ligase [Bacteroidales bacterium]|nr:pantoate--beta-alanine ligase [Bacteroidales bacterium]